MALNSTELAELIQAKIVALNPEAAGLDRSNLVNAIAEAVVEHITAKAEVRVPVVGLDLGASLSADWGSRFTNRGDAAVPGSLIPDVALQNENVPTPQTPTTAPAVSTMISTPGFIN
jgi:hypothetical protein